MIGDVVGLVIVVYALRLPIPRGAGAIVGGLAVIALAARSAQGALEGVWLGMLAYICLIAGLGCLLHSIARHRPWEPRG